MSTGPNLFYFARCNTNFRKNLHIRTYHFKMSLVVLLCDEEVPVIRVQLLNAESNKTLHSEYQKYSINTSHCSEKIGTRVSVPICALVCIFNFSSLCGIAHVIQDLCIGIENFVSLKHVKYLI